MNIVYVHMTNMKSMRIAACNQFNDVR